MNIRNAIFLTMLFVSMFSCKNEKEDVIDEEPPYILTENKGLTGRWKMVEILYDPGDGSGRFNEVSDETGSIVEFKPNGDFKETRGLLSSYFNPYTKYKLVKDGLIELSGASNNVATLHNWTYTDLTSTTVTLDFGCIERCAGKFVAIK